MDEYFVWKNTIECTSGLPDSLFLYNTFGYILERLEMENVGISTYIFYGQFIEVF
jgi:hypothetical protein